MAVEENKAIVRRWVDALNQDTPEVADHVYASDFEDGRGPARAQEIHREVRTAFPDYVLTVDDWIAEGDKVVTRWTLRGSYRQALWGMPASGKQVSWTGVTIWQIVDGKISQVWQVSDDRSLLQREESLGSA
ncbi:MAG: ester cyclase [Herpetosiphon sp.]